MTKTTSPEVLFECSLCGELLPIGTLSRGSYKKAGTHSRAKALLVLNPESVVCQPCEDDETEYDMPTVSSFHGRTDRERFEFSGTTPDPGMLQAYLLSH